MKSIDSIKTTNLYVITRHDDFNSGYELATLDPVKAIESFDRVTSRDFDKPDSIMNSVQMDVYKIDQDKFQNKFNQYLNEVDGEIDDAIALIEDDLSEPGHKYSSLIEEYFNNEPDTEDFQSREVPAINESTRQLEQNVQSLLKDILPSPYLKYNYIDAGQNNRIKVRIADHSWNPSNNQRFAGADYHISIVIANLNPTFKPEKAIVKDGIEIYFDESQSADEIATEIRNEINEIKLSLTGHDSDKKHTTMKSEILQQLKDMITIMLDDCDKYSHPHVCNMANNPNTREELESMIIEISKQSGLSVGQAIEQIERAYNPNKIED